MLRGECHSTCGTRFRCAIFNDIARWHPARWIKGQPQESRQLLTWPRETQLPMADQCFDSSNSSSSSLVTDAESSRGSEEECDWSSSSAYSSSNDDPESDADMNVYSSDETSSTFNSSGSSDETSSGSISSDSECDTDDSEMSVNTDPAELNHGEYECRLSSMKEFHTPLYDDAELSVLDSHLLMYQYALRHCITTQAFTELVRLVETHMPRKLYHQSTN